MFQTDYLRKVSLKMLTMETKSQNTKTDQVGNVELREEVDSTSELREGFTMMTFDSDL